MIFAGKVFAAGTTFYLKTKTFCFFFEGCLVSLMVFQTALVNQRGEQCMQSCRIIVRLNMHGWYVFQTGKNVEIERLLSK